MKSNFEIDQTIALTQGDSYFDLHNCYNFVGFKYKKEEKKLVCSWRVIQGDWVSKNAPNSLILKFEGVEKIKEKERDEGISESEDQTLASISFSPPKNSSNFEVVCPDYRGKDEHLSLEFHSEAWLKVWAESVTLETNMPNKALMKYLEAPPRAIHQFDVIHLNRIHQTNSEI